MRGDLMVTSLNDPHARKLQHLVERILKGPGTLDVDVRRAIADDIGVAGALAAYVETVARRPYEISDSDIEELRRAGYSEDQIFEATISAALAAGLRRLEAGLGALRTESA